MNFDRRSVIGAGIGLGSANAFATSASAKGRERGNSAAAAVPDLEPNSVEDQTATLQAAIDSSTAQGAPLQLPPGRFVVSDLKLRPGTRLLGSARATTLAFGGGDAFITADQANDLVIDGIIFDGLGKALAGGWGDGLITLKDCKSLKLSNLEIRNSPRIGLSLAKCSGRVHGVDVEMIADAGIKSLDAAGLEICGNRISHCANNGILVWRSDKGEDGTIVAHNRISKISNAGGGTGEYGNGINVFRAGSVIVSNNRISDCAYSAVRGNAASNIQIIANSCERLGEVALYAEFGFEGALIANNLVDTAAAGVSVTNFNEGGRLAVIQGNLIRNLFRREHEAEDKRGEGIGVEADAVVNGNTIENAPTVGIQIGWGSYMRDVSATGNVIRQARVGISITSGAGQCLIANNLISSTIDGAIREMNFGAMHGPDLAREPGKNTRIQLSGNSAV